ncbi:MAG: BLUF domain-containing protein [Pseudonocardia sp.]
MPDASSSETVFRLMYRSHNRIPAGDRKVEHGEIFSTARGFNKRSGISGALLLHEDTFVQVLEGDESAVRDLYAHIEKDWRHDNVTLLETGVVPERVFSRWAMARVAADGEPDIALLSHADGIHRGHPRSTTTAQEDVLDVMREAARG